MYKDILNRNLHKIVRNDPLINEINGAIGSGWDSFDTKLQDFKNQLDIDTATWALAIYEKELGIKTNVSKPLDDRRSVIKSKMRGTGKVDALLIKIVADSYTNGDVEVDFDYETSTINVRFTSVRGVPPNIGDTQQSIMEIAPAHLIIQFIYTYLFWDELERAGLTWNLADTYTWDQLETEFL